MSQAKGESKGQGESAARTAPRPGNKPAEPRQPWLWNVVLLDDQEHTYDYVIRMVQELFAANKDKALVIAQTVDKEGRAILLTTHREHAELKREQVIAFGRDPAMTQSKGPMGVVLEPVVAS